MIARLLAAAVLVAATLATASGADAPKSRPFHMGFTRWPADLTADGILTAQNFAHEHGDIVSVCFIGGIPWPESLAGGPYSKDVQDNLAYRPPAGKKLLLQIAPLNRDRKGLAPYWGGKDNLPLPKPWDARSFDSPEVLRAYLSFVLRAVEAMRPDYLAIGMENNVLLSHDPARWRQLKALNAATYTAVKAKHPALPVFFTTDVMHYRKFANEARNADQEGEVADMMKHSDLFAMSIYPHTSFAVPRPVPGDFFDFARKFGKPVAVGESGDSSRDVELKAYRLTLKGSEAGQTQFTELLLKTADRDRYAFVITFATTDFERLADRLSPPLDDLARVWAYTGMQTSGRKPKPALLVWDAYFKSPYVRGPADAQPRR